MRYLLKATLAASYQLLSILFYLHEQLDNISLRMQYKFDRSLIKLASNYRNSKHAELHVARDNVYPCNEMRYPTQSVPINDHDVRYGYKCSTWRFFFSRR